MSGTTWWQLCACCTVASVALAMLAAVKQLKHIADALTAQARTRKALRGRALVDGGPGPRLLGRLKEFQAERFAPPMPSVERKRG